MAKAINGPTEEEQARRADRNEKLFLLALVIFLILGVAGVWGGGSDSGCERGVGSGRAYHEVDC